VSTSARLRRAGVIACVALLTLVGVSSAAFAAGTWAVGLGGSSSGAARASASWVTPLVSWGKGNVGQAGSLLVTSTTSTAFRIQGLEAWSTVPAGYQSTCGLTTARALYCWGDNSYGRLGDGTTTTSKYPVADSGGGTWTAVSVGYVNACAIKTDASLWCWGYNPDGEVGNNTTASPVTVPTQVTTTGGTTWASVSVGQYMTCGLKTAGTLWCWGYARTAGSARDR